MSKKSSTTSRYDKIVLDIDFLAYLMETNPLDAIQQLKVENDLKYGNSEGNPVLCLDPEKFSELIKEKNNKYPNWEWNEHNNLQKAYINLIDKHIELVSKWESSQQEIKALERAKFSDELRDKDLVRELGPEGILILEGIFKMTQSTKENEIPVPNAKLNYFVGAPDDSHRGPRAAEKLMKVGLLERDNNVRPPRYRIKLQKLTN